MSNQQKGQAIFAAVKAVEETWKETERLIEIFDKHISEMASNKPPLRIKKTGEDEPEAPFYVYSSYQHNWELFENKKKRLANLFLSVEFRLFADDENRIVNADGTIFEQPLILVKGSTYGEWDNYEPNISGDPEEEYIPHGKMLWWSDNKDVCWLYGVPLFAIQSEDDLVRELIGPLHTLLIPKPENPDKLEQAAFANTRDVLSWQRNDRGAADVMVPSSDEAALVA